SPSPSLAPTRSTALRTCEDAPRSKCASASPLPCPPPTPARPRRSCVESRRCSRPSGAASTRTARPSMSVRGGLVVETLPDTPAAAAGLRAGDRVLAVNGAVPRDVIDVRLDAATSHVELDVEREGSRLLIRLDKDPDADLGIEFDSPAFDRMKLCNNACDFCFIRGLPRGLRRGLYLKDDDIRYSFLYGNFVTLTNLSDAEWRRLIFQRLSPLRVSVHATDPDLRRRLLRNPKAPPILDQVDELGPHGIRIHAQIVLMPG